MAFGVDYTGFLDSFDTGKVVGTGAQAKARERANSFLDAAKVGGAGVDIFGKMRAQEITDKANQYAKQEGQQADLFGKVASFAGGLGSFGAAGGFGNFGGGTDTLGVSDLQSFGRSAADIKTLESGGFIDHGYIG